MVQQFNFALKNCRFVVLYRNLNIMPSSWKLFSRVKQGENTTIFIMAKLLDLKT